jgi:lipopolysaccharide export LptBFGC system permease protein LptF
MHVLTLKDNSKLIYQFYDAQKDVFFDAVWMRSADDIWRIKTLQADPKNPIGKYVDHLTRNKEGIIEKTESFDTLLFNQMGWRTHLQHQGLIPVENRKLSELYKLFFEKKRTASYEKSEILTQVLFKSVMPFLPFICVIACAPFCVGYTRKMPLFFIYSFALFGFIAFYALMDAAVIAGENRLTSPFVAILTPFLLSCSFFIWKFVKIR